jgi:tetratricopeptide (TPR) repeat protein
LDGRLEETVAAGARLVALGEEVGSPLFARSFATIFANRALLHLGRAVEAWTTFEKGLQMAHQNVELIWDRPRRALQLAHLGRRVETRLAIRGYLEDVGNDDYTPVGFLGLIMEAAVLVEDSEMAALLATRVSDAASFPIAPPLGLTCPARLLGAAALLGDYDKAKAYYQQALAVCAKIRFRPEIALTRLQLAELLAHYPDERAEAMAHLDFAIADFRAMKMQPYLERALRHKGLLKA